MFSCYSYYGITAGHMTQWSNLAIERCNAGLTCSYIGCICSILDPNFVAAYASKFLKLISFTSGSVPAALPTLKTGRA